MEKMNEKMIIERGENSEKSSISKKVEIKPICKVCKKATSVFLVISFSGKYNKIFLTSVCSQCFEVGTNLNKVLVVVGLKNNVVFRNDKSIRKLKEMFNDKYQELREIMKENFNIEI